MSMQRLEIHTEVPLTVEMMDTIVQILVEVLSILGIAAKVIIQDKRGQMGEYLLYEYENVD